MIAKSRMKALASAMIMLGIMIISCNSATAEANSNSGLKQVKKGFSLDNPQFAIRSFFECFDTVFVCVSDCCIHGYLLNLCHYVIINTYCSQ